MATPRGFEPRTYALRVAGRPPGWSFREALLGVSCRSLTVAALERGRVRGRVGALAHGVVSAHAAIPQASRPSTPRAKVKACSASQFGKLVLVLDSGSPRQGVVRPVRLVPPAGDEARSRADDRQYGSHRRGGATTSAPLQGKTRLELPIVTERQRPLGADPRIPGRRPHADEMKYAGWSSADV